jgi:hypothetical protein
MPGRQKYRKKGDVLAIKLDLETPGLEYRKWGGKQRAKRGDWLVESDGEVYTVDARSFARTYRRNADRTFRKITPIWAERALRAGFVKTKEGQTRYARGDFIVSNLRDGGDAYAIGRATFKKTYELAQPPRPKRSRRPARLAAKR